MQQTIQHFGLTEEEIIRKDNNFYLPLTRIAEILEVSIGTLRKTIQRNREEFGEIRVDKLSRVTGSVDAYFLDDIQINILCMLQRKSEKAKQFRRALAETIDKIMKKEFVHISEVKNMLENYTILSKINPSKLGRYRNFRSVGLNRKEACRALNLPYATMKKADVVLGFRTKNDASHLIKYRFTKKLEAQNASNN